MIIPAVRLGGISVPWRIGVFAGCMLLLILILLLAAVNIGIGDYPLSISDVARIITGKSNNRIEELVVWKWRMPRALSAIVVGILLGIAGAITQSITRNALASPDILGITSGASFMAVLIIVAAPSAGPISWLAQGGIPIAALMGGLFSGFLIWLLAWRKGANPYRLVLLGIILSALNQAGIFYLISRANITDASAATFWLHGSLGLTTWDKLWPASLVLLLVMLMVGRMSFAIKTMILGETLATALGQNFRWTSFALLGIAIGSTTVAVSAAGPIGFIAFIGPQIAQRSLRLATPPLFTSGLFSGALLLLADVSVQLLPIELPVGLVTSAIGGVFLIYLLTRKAVDS